MRKINPLLFLFASLIAFSQSTNTEFEKNSIQIGVVVSNLEASVAFYKNIVGMKEVGGFSINAAFGKASGLTGGEPFDVKVLKLDNSESASEFKVMSFGNPKNQDEKFIQDRNGLRYITIFVKSIDPILENIQKNNITLLNESSLKIGDGRRFILFQDPDGIFIEIIGN